jgi:hypothetical protein
MIIRTCRLSPVGRCPLPVLWISELFYENINQGWSLDRLLYEMNHAPVEHKPTYGYQHTAAFQFEFLCNS